MRRLSFLVNQAGEDYFMVHGLDWAIYAEGRNWLEITKAIRRDITRCFDSGERPSILDFRFPDGKVVSLSA